MNVERRWTAPAAGLAAFLGVFLPAFVELALPRGGGDCVHLGGCLRWAGGHRRYIVLLRLMDSHQSVGLLCQLL
jgi:hypothetical protein